jgi:putative colanic acid biosynthesis glycosyltransferase
MIKLLQVNTVANIGSTGRIAEDIGSIALSKGWESYIAYGRNFKFSKSKLVKIGTRFDVIVHGIVTRLFDLHGRGSVYSTKKLIKNIKLISPDIIHLHNIHGYYLNYEILFNYLNKTSIPVVWTLHDCWPFTGHCVYFDFVDCNRWMTGCCNCPQLNTYPESILFDRSKINYLDKRNSFTSLDNVTFVPVSNWLSGLLVKSFLQKYPSRIIHNGIDLDKFIFRNDAVELRTKYRLGDKFVILGVAGTWSKRKGMNDFLELSYRISEDEIIVLVGLDIKQIKLLPFNIVGISHTDGIDELAKLYSVAGVFVNSTYEDNFPTTNLESLACGTPIITYNTGGSIEAVFDKAGYTVEKGDLDKLLSIIRVVKNNGKEFYKSECRNVSTNYFNKKDRFEEYFNLYQSLLKSK